MILNTGIDDIADGTDGQSSVSGVVTSLTLDANGQYQFRTDTGQGKALFL